MEDSKKQEKAFVITPDNTVGVVDPDFSPEVTMCWIESCIVRTAETLAERYEQSHSWNEATLSQIFTLAVIHATLSKEGYLYRHQHGSEKNPTKIIRGPWRYSSRN